MNAGLVMSSTTRCQGSSSGQSGVSPRSSSPPFVRIGRRLLQPGPVQRHGAQLGQESVPGVALVGAQRGEGVHPVGQQRGVDFGQ